MPNHSPPLALPVQAPPLPKARLRFSLSLDSRHWAFDRRPRPSQQQVTSSLAVAVCSSASMAGRGRTSSSSPSSLNLQYKDLHLSASSNSPHADHPFLFYFCLFLSLPSFVPCRCTIALLECVCAALAGSTSGHWATNSIPHRPLVWAWQYGVRPVQAVSINDRDCGTCDMSPPAWDLEAQLRISQPPKISRRGATNHLLWLCPSLEIRRRDLSH